ncbi:MAG: uncharacterized protein KVP18_001193 [Porospora cf. gigantea A]|uniref:uncharacterized protein n=1 Tax=Porospora cf. gigantea A TaxID=2853593 RepID=UPI00355970B2|nr:MAG: hypothetical protein KVP18_001193 [Porospora cf. gigantea A]
MRLLRSIQHQIEQTNKALDEKQERHRSSWCLAVNPHGAPRIAQHCPHAPEPPVSLNVEETNAPNEPQTQKKPNGPSMRRRKTPKNAPRRPSTPYPVDNQPQPSGRYQEYFFEPLASVIVKEPTSVKADSTPLQSTAPPTCAVEEPGVNSDYGDAAIGRLVTEIFDVSGSWSDSEYSSARDSDPEAAPAADSPPASISAADSPPASVPAIDSPLEEVARDSSPVGTTPGEVDSIHLDLTSVNPEQDSRSSASSISPISWIEKLADYERRWCDTKTNVRRTRLQKQALEDDMERLKTEIQGLIHDVMEGTSSANRATQCDIEESGKPPSSRSDPPKIAVLQESVSSENTALPRANKFADRAEFIQRLEKLLVRR